MTAALLFALILGRSVTLVQAGDSISVPANLKVEGIPPIPGSLTEILTRYNESRSASLLDWHPTRREILILTRFGDVPQIHRVAMPGGARTQLTFYPDRVSGGSFQPTRDDSVLFSKDTGGAERFQFYLADLKEGSTSLLTDGKSRNQGAVWSNDGRRIAFTSTRRNGKDNDIYLMDPSDSGSTRLLSQVEGGGWAVSDWSPDDRSLLVEEYISINESRLYLTDAGSGRRDLLTQPGEKAAYSSAVYSRDGRGVYLTTDHEAEFKRLAFLDLAGRKLTFLRPDLNWDVDDIALSRDGRRLAYLVNEDGSHRLHVLDTKTSADLRLPEIPTGVISSLRWHKNSRDLGFTLSSARSPADVYSIDVEAGTFERWTRSETGGLNPANFSEPELIRWKSFDGRTISGYLYRPPGKFAAPHPVVIDIHGGPEGQYKPGYLGSLNYQINELGVAQLFPNVRGSAGYGKTFLLLDNGTKREDAVKDIGALLDWVATQKDLDSRRIMVTGGSYGGYMTLASIARYNDRLCCALDVVGISNFITFLERTESYRRDLRRAEYGDERDPKMREFLDRISPVNQAGSISKPLFVVQGRNDPRVPYTESEQMVAAIRKGGGTVWYLMADDEGHGFSKKRNRDFQTAATILFLRQFLLGK